VKKFVSLRQPITGFRELARAAHEPQHILPLLAHAEPRSLTELNRMIEALPPLVPGADRAVPGEGPEGAAIALVGEQPGDQEEREGRPFVGPAGMLLNHALKDAGIDRNEVYVTNAVNHFKYVQRGKRRMHQKPTAGDIQRYRWWLFKELEFVHPRLVVALGSTAIQSLAGKALPVSRARGEAQFNGYRGYVTVHPSYLLRIPDEADKRRAYAEFRHGLERIRELAAG
jgi:DNA polymerase